MAGPTMFSTRKFLAVLIAYSLLSGATASAAVEGIGTYRLRSHPDGNQLPPAYGLRLDGLDGDSSLEWTFDFDAAGSAMFLTYDGSTIHIFGTSFGGEDGGTTYVSGTTGFFAIDFTYNDKLITMPTDDPDHLFDVGGVGNKANGFNFGTITSLGPDGSVGGGDDLTLRSGTPTVNLVDQANSDGDIFHFTDGGHRGESGLNGWGWLSYDDSGTIVHEYSTDWLFTAELVPEPSSLLIWSLLGACFCFVGLSRKLRK